MLVARYRIRERVRDCWVLICFDHQPTCVIELLEFLCERQIIHTPIPGHRKNPFKYGIQKAAVTAYDLLQHCTSNILAVDMGNPLAVLSNSSNRVRTGKNKMPRIDQQAHCVISHAHKLVNIFRRLHKHTHVVVIG